ncbi:MAG: hypothetical protein A3A80_01785 [Candidatus Terrybacteria bacterium RIFCSPLOWO2_01_FULL_44_24]|uniref:Histidine--tRNA ligase n=1 Tax=Candidatus Terrybacteria bacterium RIFCSPHIGHO2_01_FULL_43_35 TaxID=1802361 RepID=A0A1G2PE19_9BACT|nr:MAG: hypothetical protein A2828_01575 [Candidatus Terrybacteria bacterium RIFCSPHIGHO2_01_FULL_43_35]OHA50815.1 MAG: hypothetical protein A3A80_01785 [Candidatus Terrybacteria bacterium RIFCSPLOWO2_01_FULL_44_24]
MEEQDQNHKRSRGRHYFAPSGMHDILPQDQNVRNYVYETVSELASDYGFGRIDTPIVEQAELFSKGIGTSTDIVEHEMYFLKTKGGEVLALRPEGTAPIVRAYTEHGMHVWPQPVKLWYWGPMFRHERQQRGRFRQFWQYGFEVIGGEDAAIDAEVIQLMSNILKEFGLKDITIQINSIGCSQCRPYYKKALVHYYRPHIDKLCANCRRRIKVNPMRMLDCKDERCARFKQNAPQIVDHLCEDCRKHLKTLLEFLEEISLPYFLNPYLVRGLDYYNRTVFEIWPQEVVISEYKKGEGEAAKEDNQQSQSRESPPKFALVAGGRYDNLVKILGGRPAPAFGAAAGVERIIYELKRRNLKIPEPRKPRVFLIQLGDLAKRKSLKLFEELRQSGIKIASSFGRDSIKSQLKLADKLGVDYTLILGQKEALENTVIVRDMHNGEQLTVQMPKLHDFLKARLSRRAKK